MMRSEQQLAFDALRIIVGKIRSLSMPRGPLFGARDGGGFLS